MNLPSLSVIVMVVTFLALLIWTTGFFVVRVTTNTSLSSMIASSLVAMTILSVAIPGLKLSSAEEIILKSASLAVLGETIALKIMWK